MSSNPNAREFTRVPLKLEIHLITGGKKIVSHETKDISMNGVFVINEEKLPEGSDCDISIFFGETENPMHLEAKGKIERNTSMGMAVKFIEIGLESYEHLHNLVLYNAHENTTKVEKEFKDHLGLKKRD